MITFSSAGFFLSGVVCGYLVFWLRQRYRRTWLQAFQRRKYSMRQRPTYHIRLSRGRGWNRAFGRYYGHVPRINSRDFT